MLLHWCTQHLKVNEYSPGGKFSQFFPSGHSTLKSYVHRPLAASHACFFFFLFFLVRDIWKEDYRKSLLVHGTCPNTIPPER